MFIEHRREKFLELGPGLLLFIGYTLTSKGCVSGGIRMSRRGLLGGCSLPAIMLIIATAGQAADVAPPPAHDWSGLYLGGFVGYGDVDSNGFFASSLDLGFGGGSS